MKKHLLSALILLLLTLTACGPRVYTEEDIISLSLKSSMETVKLGTGEVALFTVSGLADDGTEIPCEAEIFCNGEKLDHYYLETGIAGTYEITAKYNDIVSEPISVEVLPEDKGRIFLTPFRTTIAKGASLTLKSEAYSADGANLSDEWTLYYLDGEVIPNNKFKSKEPGVYFVTAKSGIAESEPFAIGVASQIKFNMSLEASKTEILLGESVEFTYSAEPMIDMYANETSTVKLYCVQTGKEAEDIFTPTEAGIYSFYAERDNHVSKTIDITVSEPKTVEKADLTTFPGYESEIPVIIIDTNGSDITKEKSTATMYIYDKEINKAGDEPDIVTLIDIKLRGQSSLLFPKKQYTIHTKNDDGSNNNLSLLGMPAENDWVLNGSYADKSLIKNSLMFDLMGKVTDYSARNEFCEVYITRPDGTLNYMGIYSLIEKIKIDANRVNIHKMTPEDENITGGYIVSIDKIVADEVVVETSLWDMTVVSPNDKSLTDAQYEYISQYLKEFSLALESENRADPENGYRKYFEPESIVGQLLLDEWIRNIDCMRFSAYFYKDQDGKLKFGPPWDFDITCGRCDYGDGGVVEGWEMGSMNDLCCHLMWDPTFVQMFVDTWKEYRATFLTDELIVQYIDEKVAELGEAPLARSLARWSNQWDGNTYVWPNPVGDLYSNNHAEEIQFIKDFLLARAKWIDENIDDLLVGDIKEKIW